MITLLAFLSLGAWLYLLTRRGRFWQADQRLPDAAAPPPAWPAVVALVPARDEAAVIGETVRRLLGQEYPGRLTVILADDHSRDGTGEIARETARAAGGLDRLTVVQARELPAGWSGKLWALAEAQRAAVEHHPKAELYWLTDADIAHDPGSLRRLVTKAETEGLDLVSLMVRLEHGGAWARLLIPAFVFFFQKLYPFPWVNEPGRKTAAAAGGCVLIRRATLGAIGGFERIRGALIDDVALARAVKAGPEPRRIWLGLTGRVRSLRPYRRLGDIWDMVARTAYTELDHSPARLAGTVAGMALLYLLPPLALLAAPVHQQIALAAGGAAAWAAMTVAFRPTLRLYGEPATLGLLLPMAGLLYTLMTLDSARRHWQGRGGRWKGRTLQPAGGTGRPVAPSSSTNRILSSDEPAAPGRSALGQDGGR